MWPWEMRIRHRAFRLCLPVRQPLNNAITAAIGSRAESDSMSKQVASADILIVEDNPANQKVLGIQLAHLGFKADVVSSGQEAIDTLTRASHKYKLVLMDIQMPGMDGLTATQKIREWEQKHGLHVQIVAITARTTSENRADCFSAGMDDFLGKPLHLSELRCALSRLLKK